MLYLLLKTRLYPGNTVRMVLAAALLLVLLPLVRPAPAYAADYTAGSFAELETAITNANSIGRHSVVLEVTDGTDSMQQVFTITVGDQMDAPYFTSTLILTVTLDTPYTYTIAASDTDGDTLTITAPTRPAWLALTDQGDGTATLSGTPGTGDAGIVAVKLTVSDATFIASHTQRI